MNGSMSIQIKEGHVRATPSFLGQIVGRVRYGDRVTVLGQKGPWRRVLPADGSAAGWIHGSALTSRRIVLQAGAADVQEAATTEELALAGKGFSEQVEGEFRAKHPGVDFSWVDRMERITVTPEQIKRFLENGGLTPRGGGL